MIDINVSEYGVTPDGVTNWQDSFPVQWDAMLKAACVPDQRIVFPPGFYATGMQIDNRYCGAKIHFEPGAEFGGLFHIINHGATDSYPISWIERISGVVRCRFKRAHGFAVGEWIELRGIYGTKTNFNTERVQVTSVPNSVDVLCNWPGIDDVFNATYSASLGNKSPVTDVTMTGTLVTYDRLGTICANRINIENLHIKSDGAKHSFAPGTKSRGVHLYFGTRNLTIGNVTIDDTDAGVAANTNAAFSADGYYDAPHNLNIGKIWVRKTDAMGVYLAGSGNIDEIQVDEYAKGTISMEFESLGLARCAEGKGVWTNRAAYNIGSITVSQSSSDARLGDKYAVLIDETGDLYMPMQRDKGMTIGSIATNGARINDVSFGDPSYPPTYCVAKVDAVTVTPPSSRIGTVTNIGGTIYSNVQIQTTVIH